MSHYTYVADHKHQLLLEVGNHISRDMFIDSLEEWKRFIDAIYDEMDSIYRVCDLKVTNLRVEDLGILIEMIRKIPVVELQGNIATILWVWKMLDDWNDWDVISENKLDDYPRYQKIDVPY